MRFATLFLTVAYAAPTFGNLDAILDGILGGLGHGGYGYAKNGGIYGGGGVGVDIDVGDVGVEGDVKSQVLGMIQAKLGQHMQGGGYGGGGAGYAGPAPETNVGIKVGKVGTPSVPLGPGVYK